MFDCNHIINKQVVCSLIMSYLNAIQSNYKYLIFGVWLRNPDYIHAGVDV